MPVTAKPIERVQKSPEERAAAKGEREANKLRRDRVRMLDGVQTLLRHAAAAIATGSVARHDDYMDAALNQLEAYRTFVSLSTEATKTDPE
jgi:hypothetical protein